MSAIDFDLPIWSASIYHSVRGADNPWNRAFNLAEVEDQTENEKQAIKTAVELFEADGLGAHFIYAIEVGPLINPDDEGRGIASAGS